MQNRRFRIACGRTRVRAGRGQSGGRRGPCWGNVWRCGGGLGVVRGHFAALTSLSFLHPQAIWDGFRRRAPKTRAHGHAHARFLSFKSPLHAPDGRGGGASCLSPSNLPLSTSQKPNSVCAQTRSFVSGIHKWCMAGLLTVRTVLTTVYDVLGVGVGGGSLGPGNSFWGSLNIGF